MCYRVPVSVAPRWLPVDEVLLVDVHGRPYGVPMEHQLMENLNAD